MDRLSCVTRRPARLLLGTCMLIAGALFADTIRLRDGSEIRGDLKSCDDVQCSIGSRKVPIDRIAVIELHEGIAIPPTAGGGAVVLTDGSVHGGHFTGLSLREVDTDEGELDRDTVAVIIVAEGIAAAARDVVIFRDASQRIGRLQSCTPGSCVLDGERLRIEGIRWIGLRQEGTAPPSVETAGDLVYVSDVPQAARMASVQSKKVNTTHGTFPRDKVTWMRFGEKKPTSHEQMEAPIAEVQEPARTEPAPGTPTTASTPPPATDKKKAGGRRGALWTGVIEAHLDGTTRIGGQSINNNLVVRLDVRLREETQDLLVDNKVAGTVTHLHPEQTTLRNEFRSSGALVCFGEGTVTIDAEEEFRISTIMHKTKDVSTKSSFGYEMPLGKELYTVGVTPKGHPKYQVSCNRGGGREEAYISPHLGRSPLLGNAPHPYEDPELRYVEGGRMLGKYTVKLPRIYDQMVVNWAICREGVECPQRPTDESPPAKRAEPCSPPDVQRALMDPIWNRRQARARQLKSDWEELREAHQKMQDNREAWNTAISTCAIEQIGEKVIDEFFSEAGGQGAEFVEFVNSVLNGDLSGIGGENVAAFNDALDLANQLATATTLKQEDLEHQLEDCKLPRDVREAAKSFVEAYGDIQRLMPQVQKEINDIHSDDLQYWDRWLSYYEACREYATCMQKNPDDCPKPPDRPKGPIPGQQTSLPTGPPH